MIQDEKKLFPGQQKGEIVEFCSYFHWITLIPYIVVLSAFTFLVFTITTTWLFNDQNIISDTALVLIKSTIALIYLHVVFIKIINYFLKIIIVTNYRIVVMSNTSIFKRESKTIDFINIQDIQVSEKGLFARLFNYGKIILHNSAGEKIFIFRYVPNALKNYNVMNHIYRKVVNRTATI